MLYVLVVLCIHSVCLLDAMCKGFNFGHLQISSRTLKHVSNKRVLKIHEGLVSNDTKLSNIPKNKHNRPPKYTSLTLVYNYGD